MLGVTSVRHQVAASSNAVQLGVCVVHLRTRQVVLDTTGRIGVPDFGGGRCGCGCGARGGSSGCGGGRCGREVHAADSGIVNGHGVEAPAVKANANGYLLANDRVARHDLVARGGSESCTLCEKKNKKKENTTG